MSPPEPRRDPPAGGHGTSPKGTAEPVRLGAAPGARTTIALLLAGPVIWSLHFVVVYLAVEAGCTGDGPGLDAFDPPVPTQLTLVATAVAAVACLATAAWAFRRTRRGPDRTLTMAGGVLSLLGFATVLFVGLPALVLPACGP